MTGHTLTDPDHPVILESINFPEPVISQAIEPKTTADQDRLGIALARLSEEDPTFQTRTDHETGQTIISGMGELHLEVIVNRMLREYRVGANVGKLQVAFTETIARPAKGEGRFVRQTGGRGQYGHAWLELEPLPRGGGFEFVNKIVGGAIPREYISAVEGGVREALESGGPQGLPARGFTGHALRRVVPRRRLVGDRVSHRRVHGVAGSSARRCPDDAGTDYARGSCRAGNEPR